MGAAESKSDHDQLLSLSARSRRLQPMQTIHSNEVLSAHPIRTPHTHTNSLTPMGETTSVQNGRTTTPVRQRPRPEPLCSDHFQQHEEPLPPSNPCTPRAHPIPLPSLHHSSAICSDRPYKSNPFSVFNEHIVIATVGLPARGKSYISSAIIRYMNYLGCRSKLFNAGNVRREQGLAGTGADFFDRSNHAGRLLRDEMAMVCLEELLGWIKGDGCSVGILDATNTTRARRLKLIERCRRESEGGDRNIKLIFIESLADDPVLLEQSYTMKLANADYGERNRETALADFKDRVKRYEEVYEPISDELDGPDTRYIKLINAGKKLISNNIDGYVLGKVQRLLYTVHLKNRNIWLALVGETTNDIRGILGGDPNLSEEGRSYSQDVCRIVSQRDPSSPENAAKPLLVLTGTLQRYRTMVQDFEDHPDTGPCHTLTLGAANDLCGGLLDSLSSEDRKEHYPQEIANRHADRLNYRYPGVGGESYQDLIARSNELVCHLEQNKGDSLVIADRSVFRAILGYFMGKSIEELPFLDVQPGILELRRNHSGFTAIQLRAKVGKATSSAGAGTCPYMTSKDSRAQLVSLREQD